MFRNRIGPLDKIRAYWFTALLSVGTLFASPAMAQLGLVADNTTNSVNVFDVNTNSVVASVAIDPGSIGDVAITPDQALGFVTNFNSQVFVIDLTASPPSLATGTNPIAISNFGEELSVTPDGRLLLVSDGSATQPISVVDIASRAEISTFPSGTDVNSHDTCDDGTSVLVTSFNATNVRRLTLAADGTLTDTGEVLPLPGSTFSTGTINVHCAPGSSSGVVVTFFDNAVRSFTIPGLAPVDTRPLSGFGISAVFSPAADRLFVRSSSPGTVEAFTYNSATGGLGAMSDDSVGVAPAPAFFAMDQLAIRSDGAAVYVPEGFGLNAVNVYDATNLMGALLASITDPNIVQPTGIALPKVVPFEAFDVALEIDDDDEFELDGRFELGAASNGIDPLTEDVTLEIDSFSVTVPAGSFAFDDGAFEFEGVIDGVELEVEIKQRSGNNYRIEVEAEGADLSGVTDPVTVVLTIGDDGGETIVDTADDD